MYEIDNAKIQIKFWQNKANPKNCELRHKEMKIINNFQEV